MSADALKVLKKMVLQESDFDKIWSYFLDNFGDNVEFLKQGVPLMDTSHPLFQVIIQTFRDVLKRNNIKEKSAVVMQISLVQYEAEGFIHGAGLIDGHFAGVMFFREINVGMFYLMLNGMQLVRFTMSLPPPPDTFKPEKFKH